MRVDARMLFTAALFAACVVPLAGCGGSGQQGGNSVQMKDLEVVDGTTTDAMTDLDGVQSEGTAVALPAANADNASDTPARAVEKDDSEALPDQ
jgi:hypothetical protein